MKLPNELPGRPGIEQTLNEIREMYQQYKNNLPARGIPWPESVGHRIIELWKVGVTTKEIAEKTGLPAQRLYIWRQQVKNNFHANGSSKVEITHAGESECDISGIKQEPARTKKSSETTSSTVNLTYRDIRIEEVPIEEVVSLIQRLTALQD
jgi:hypothetical protein